MLIGLFALASGTGLVAMVGWSLLQAAQQSRERAELDARTRARELAQALRAALRSPAVLQLVDPAERFAVQQGNVVCPREVGWLWQRPAAPVDPVVAERLRLAQVAEFARDDASSAKQQFDELLGPQGPQGDGALPVVLAAAWQAHRAGDTARRDELAQRLIAPLAPAEPTLLANPTFAELVAGTALLDASRGHDADDGRLTLLAALPPDLATPLFARLAERGRNVDELRAAAHRIEAQRSLLVTVHELLPQLDTSPLARGAAGRLLLWFADAEHQGTGTGALAAPTVLLELVGLGTRETQVAGLPTVPDVEGLVFKPPASDSEEVVPQLAWVVPAPVLEPSWFARPTAVVAATLVLVFVFGGSLWFAARALRRETLAMRARSEFLTGVTHELKTPIASIRLVAEVLTDDDVPPHKQREYFALLAGESARLSMLIDNVLDLGQMERGERAYDLRSGDIAEVVREATRLFAPLALQSGMQLTLREGAVTVPATIDRGALLQALLAVFENARKYAAAGGRLDVTTAVDEKTFTIVVRDFGPGVPADEREAIFQRFHRGTAHRHRSIPGVGLGLYLARTIVQHHGGELRCVEPPTGAGAQFSFSIPLAAEGTA